MTSNDSGGRKRVVIHEDDVGMTHGSNVAFVERYRPRVGAVKRIQPFRWSAMFRPIPLL